MPVGELMKKLTRTELLAWAKYYEYKASLAKGK